jgi:uncharacterized protein (TIGR03086 family)
MPDGTRLLQSHTDALAYTGAIVAAIGPSSWDAPTPCEDWNVRELVLHVVAGNWWAARLAAGATIEEVGTELDGDLLGDDPSGAYEGSARAAADIFAEPGALDAPCAVSYGPVPGSVYLGHRFVDVLIHGRDLAVATGQDPTLPKELVAVCWDVIEPQLDMLRASGAFGPERDLDPTLTGEPRLLAVLGRE